MEVDTVHVHWVSCLFAAGLGERGKEVSRGGWLVHFVTELVT